jgi:ankyrin repeat protein
MSETLKQRIINAITDNDFEALDTFIDNGNVSVIACLLKMMIQTNFDGLKHLVEEKNALDVKYDNVNILTLACQFEWIEAVQFLCQFELLTNDDTQQSRYLLNPLFASMIYEKIDIIKYLLNNERKFIEDVVPVSKDNVIHIAVSVDNNDILETVLVSLDMDNKYVINAKNTKGWTPLHLAVIANELESVKTLVEHGADINLMDKTSKTPLEVAHDEGYNDIFEYLREKSGEDHFESISLS